MLVGEACHDRRVSWPRVFVGFYCKNLPYPHQYRKLWQFASAFFFLFFFLCVCMSFCVGIHRLCMWNKITFCLSNLLPFVYISLHLFSSCIIGFMCLRLTLQIHKLFALNWWDTQLVGRIATKWQQNNCHTRGHIYTKTHRLMQFSIYCWKTTTKFLKLQKADNKKNNNNNSVTKQQR